MRVVPVSADYLDKLESAVLAAEWWLADPKVSVRKDGGQRTQVFKAADAVRERKEEHGFAPA